MEKVQWKVEGMDCTNCALTIRRYLEKEGMKDVKVNFGTGDVLFELNGNANKEKLATGIQELGYQVVGSAEEAAVAVRKRSLTNLFRNHWQRFLFCLPFTLLLSLHMLQIHFEWLMNPWMQLALCLPVFFVGMSFFGKSAWKSLRNGIPNMNVLIAVGATASFVYSLYGTLSGQAAQYAFYETTATIITLVFLGNYLEDASVHSTQRALHSLAKSQKVMANMIAFDDQHQEQVFAVENTTLRTGDLVLIKTGEQVPADCKILWGTALVNESLLTGESVPVAKAKKDLLVGGSVLTDGTIKAQVTAAGNDTVLAGIINLVKRAQGEKPPVQLLADRISAIFVPVVLGIAALTFVVNWIVLSDFTTALMRSIAVLVIACPCAMGLATPAAIAVGLGRGARSGILFRNASSLELFKDIRQVVFDKTGTLTTGHFRLAGYAVTDPSITDEQFRALVYSLEKYSNHPIAKSIAGEWRSAGETRWKKIEEVKGAGMRAEDSEGQTYLAGSRVFAGIDSAAGDHNVYVARNGKLLGWLDVADEVRPEARAVVDYLKSRHIRTVLLSGDKLEKTKQLGDQLGIAEVIAEQTPEQKLKQIERLSAEQPTAMIGDGINDAPALAKATVGISLSDASHFAMQTAQVVLMNNGIKHLPLAIGLGHHTYLTIRQNLFWAFAYNIVAIPVAALGFLTPAFSALAMGLSDVVLAINSVRLFVKKVA